MLSRFNAHFQLLRPRSLARTTKSVETLTSELSELRRLAKAQVLEEQRRRDVLESLCARVEALAGEVRQVGQALETLAAREAELRAVLHADGMLDHKLAGLPRILDEARIVAHVERAIAAAPLRLEPFPHCIIDPVLPEQYFSALIRGIPPREQFHGNERNRRHVKVPLTVAPAYSRRVWNFMISVVQRALQPLLVDKFREPLSEWIVRHWPSLAADPFGDPMDLVIADGRIMLHGRGYRIPPHRDPKWGFLTCILYLAHPEDSEAWGTELYAVSDDDEAAGAAPHWIDERRCRLVDIVPYRANTMLVFLNSTGAHGARIPDDAEPADLERYIYQFRIGPGGVAIPPLMAMLPEEQRAFWAGKRPMM
jgi:hypothetical protein